MSLSLSLSVPESISAGSAIRMVGTKDSPLFHLPDLCRVLGNANSRQVSTRLRGKEKHVHNVDTLRGSQPTTFVTESGLYRVILTSRAENAAAFQDWVCEDVLPTIRRYGCYPAPAASPDPLPDARELLETMLRMARDQGAADQRIRDLEARLATNRQTRTRPASQPPGRVQSKILDWLAANPAMPWRLQDLANNTEEDYDSVRKACAALADAGRINRLPGNRYSSQPQT